MSPQRIRWLALAAIPVVLLIGYMASFRSATILVDGESIEISTRALTVGGALKAAEVALGPDDEVEPGPFSVLRNGALISVNRAMQIEVLADGERYALVSTGGDAGAILAELGIEMEEADRLLLGGRVLELDEQIPFAPIQRWEVRRAVAFTLVEDEADRPVRSSALNIGAAPQENGVTLYEGDRILPSPETPLSQGLIVQLERAEPLEIQIGEQAVRVRTAASSVGEALAEAGIALQGLDRSEPEESAAIPDTRRIVVTRVLEQVELQTETIPFTVEWQPDPNTEIDERSVIQAGQNGIRANSQRVRYENGVEVSRVDEGEWMLAEPVTQISGYGTKIVVRSAVVDGQTIEYWRTLELFATSYSPCRSGVETCYYYTALGDEVKQGIAAVYLSWWYAMGQHTVYVPGYGHAKISDNGAYPDGRPWIDLGYSDEDWVPWAEWVTVYFTTPIPPEHEILYLLP